MEGLRDGNDNFNFPDDGWRGGRGNHLPHVITYTSAGRLSKVSKRLVDVDKRHSGGLLGRKIITT